MPTTDGAAGPIHWFQAGHGDPLVLIHGLGGDAGFWARDLAALRDRFQVIAVDLRGSGRTPPSPGGHSIEDLADDLATVLDALDLPRAHVVGVSMGGNVAQSFALRHPGRLDRLVLASTFATMNPRTRRLDAVLAVQTRGGDDREIYDLTSPWLFSPKFIADPAHAAYLAYPGGPGEANPAGWRNAYLAQRAFDSRGWLSQITAATLVLVGEEDSLVTVSDAAVLLDQLPAARLERIAGAGHLINIESPDAFRAAVAAHVGGGAAG